MTKPNRFDGVLNQIVKTIEGAANQGVKEFKNVKPFDQKEIPVVDRIWAFDSLTPDQMNVLVQKHGTNKINLYIAEMQQLKAKRGI